MCWFEWDILNNRKANFIQFNTDEQYFKVPNTWEGKMKQSRAKRDEALTFVSVAWWIQQTDEQMDKK